MAVNPNMDNAWMARQTLEHARDLESRMIEERAKRQLHDVEAAQAAQEAHGIGWMPRSEEERDLAISLLHERAQRNLLDMEAADQVERMWRATQEMGKP